MFSNHMSEKKVITARKIRWAILGTSLISHTMASAIQHSSQSELYAIGSRTKKSVNDFGDKFNIAPEHRYVDLKTLLKNPDIDAVYIGLPNHLHKEWIVLCADAGKHVLCEKPLVLNECEYDEIHAAVVKNKVICLEALMYRHHPFIKKLLSLIQDVKIIGDVQSFEASYLADIAHLANPLAGGATRNLGCYPLSLIRLLADTEPTRIDADGVLNTEVNADHFANIRLEFPNNIIANITTQDNPDKKQYQFIIRGTLGTLTCLTNPWMPEIENNLMKVELNNGSAEIIAIDANKPIYTYQIDLVNYHILKGTISEINTESFKHSRGNVCVIREIVDQVVDKQARRMATLGV